MSEVETEKSTLGGFKSALILGGTLVAGIWAASVVLPVIAAHLVLSAIVGGAAAGYVAYDKDRREKAQSLFSKVGSFYKDAWSGFRSGWKRAVANAEAKAQAAAEAPEAGGTSPLASKEAGSDFNATGAKVTVTHKAPAPAAKPAPGPGM